MDRTRIQIQLLLKLNTFTGWSPNHNLGIQIQLLLKLNLLTSLQAEMIFNSNTTLVKVKLMTKTTLLK